MLLVNTEYFSVYVILRQIEKLRRCELITENEVKQLCSKARLVF